MQTRVTVAFIYLVLTAIASVSRVTCARKASNAIPTLSMVAWVRGTFIYVTLTKNTLKTLRTTTLVTVGSIHTLGSVLTGSAGTLINVNLAHGACETSRTAAGESIDHVFTKSSINTRTAVTFINVQLTECTSKACHTNTGEFPNSIQTGGIILAGSRQALVDIGFTSRTGVTSTTLALERTLSVHTTTKVLTGVGTYGAFIHILVTSSPGKTRRTCADCSSIHWVGVTHGILVARITNTCIFQMTQETCLSHGTLAVKRGHSVMAGGAVEADGGGAVIDVLTAALAGPSIDTDTRVPTQSVKAGPAIVARVGLELAFVYIFCTELTCPLRRTLTIVSVDSVHTRGTIHAFMIRTVIHVYLTVCSFKTWQADTLIGEVSSRATGASILALGWRAWHIVGLTELAGKSSRTAAAKRTGRVDALSSILAEPDCSAFVNILPAAASLVSWRAGAVVAAVPISAAGSVLTWVCGTGIDERTIHTSKTLWAATFILDTPSSDGVLACSCVKTRRWNTRIFKLAIISNPASGT